MSEDVERRLTVNASCGITSPSNGARELGADNDRDVSSDRQGDT